MNVIKTPDWVKQAVFYEIFPDRFAKTARPRHRLPAVMQVPLEEWDASPQFHSYKGGDLWGVAEKLDYLVELGVTAIYFTPIFQSASNHRYHTHDYYKIDPLLGGESAFDELLQAAHDRNLKVVLDGVFNHASRGFFYFNDILENGQQSPWIDWFRVEGWPLSAYDGSKPANYQGWWDMRALPVFNHDYPPVREYLMTVGEYWIRKGIDGWRLDVPSEIKAEGFWQEFRDRIKAINPDAYILGEIWDDASEWLQGDQFDGVMNYPFTSATLAFVAGKRVDLSLAEGPGYYPYPAIDAATYGDQIVALLERYPWEIQLTQLNLLDSHDTARALSVVGEDRASYGLALLLLMTFPGAPSLFYGDEVGLLGGLDPDCRRGFPPETEWDQTALNLHKQLIALRRMHPALSLGSYQRLAATGMGYGFARCLGQTELKQAAVPATETELRAATRIVAVNAGETMLELVVEAEAMQALNPPFTLASSLLYGEGSVQYEADGRLLIQIPPRSGLVA